jgi:L-fucose isomerase-like protein
VAKPGPLTLCRITQDADGAWKGLVAQGQFEDQPAETFDGYGWCRIAHLQRLYRDMLLRHFPHHVAITESHVGNSLWEALGHYLGLQIYHPRQETPGLYTPAQPFG